MKGHATLKQKQSNALFNGTHPDPGKLYSDLEGKYLDAARKQAKQADGIEGTLYELFGPEFIGSLAFRLDPTAQLVLTGNLFSPKTRRRDRTSALPKSWFYTDSEVVAHYANYVVDIGGTRDEFLVESHANDLGTTDRSSQWYEPDFVCDTTLRTRGIGQPFGELVLHKYKSHLQELTSVDSIKQVESVKQYIDPGNTQYDLVITTTIRRYTGPPAWADASPFGTAADLESWLLSVVQDNIEKLLPRCLASKRLFNTFYQIGELKDIPQTIKGISELKDLFYMLSKGDSSKLSKADKILANQHLNNEFGINSLLQAGNALLKLPERAAKRLNYLISKNNKVVLGRAETKLVSAPRSVDWDNLSFTYDLPWWATLEEESFNYSNPLSLRMAVSQTIQFPPSAVPTYSDTNYRDLLGLNPRPVDIYNLVPWTWLVDWFAGLGDYINCIDAINSDKQLIHYGFVTGLIDETLTHNYRIGVSDHTIVLDKDGGTIEEAYSDRSYQLANFYNRHFQKRFWMNDLEGVKSVSNLDFGLTDFQKSILGALLAKYA